MFNLGGRGNDGLPGGNDNITISDLTMNGMEQLQGALFGFNANYLTVFNVYFHNYTY